MACAAHVWVITCPGRQTGREIGDERKRSTRDNKKGRSGHGIKAGNREEERRGSGRGKKRSKSGRRGRGVDLVMYPPCFPAAAEKFSEVVGSCREAVSC